MYIATDRVVQEQKRPGCLEPQRFLEHRRAVHELRQLFTRGYHAVADVQSSRQIGSWHQAQCNKTRGAAGVRTSRIAALGSNPFLLRQ